MSTAYYAMFHRVARSAADMLIGSSGQRGQPAAWRQVYRALDHGTARTACRDGKAFSSMPFAIQEFAVTFAVLQDLRHLADYDPDARFSKTEVLEWVTEAERVIANFEAAPATDRRAFCAAVLFRRR